MIYNIKQTYEFVCYMCNCLAHQKEGKVYSSSDLFLLAIVIYISIFNIFISKITFYTLFDEVLSVERFNGN